MSRKSIPAKVKELVWRRDCNNSLDGKCYVCESPISYNNCHMAHVIPVVKGGTNAVNNLHATCQSCNLSMGSMNLHEFKNTYIGSSTAKSFTAKPSSDYVMPTQKPKQSAYKPDRHLDPIKIFKIIHPLLTNNNKPLYTKISTSSLLYLTDIFSKRL